MYLTEVLYIFILAAVIWYWLETMKIKEAAYQAARNACVNANVTFLDDSVAIHKFRIFRDTNGNFKARRIYHFEFTSDGSQRYHGEIHLVGKRIDHVELDAYRII